MAGDAPSQTLRIGDRISAQWWEQFRSPDLDRLVRRSFQANPTIDAAVASLRQARYNTTAQEGFFFPTIQASYAPSRTKLSGNTGGNSPGIQGNGSVISTVSNTPASQGGTAPFNEAVIYNWHSATLTVGYVPDVFGANRRLVESLQAQSEFQGYQLEAAYLTLASNVVAAAIQEASTRDQIRTVQALIDSSERALKVLREQFRLGYAMRIDVAAQELALAQAQQSLPPLEKQLEQTRDLIRVLAGTTPDQDLNEHFTMASLTLPAELPLSLPSELVSQRPDILSAEAQLHAASAQVGVAIAARIPQFSINSTLGGNASEFSQMFWPSGKLFSLTGNVAQTLFDGGTLKARQRAAEEGLNQAQAMYRSTVLTAFQNVADTLHAIHADAHTHAAAERAVTAARVSFELTEQQYRLGYVSYLTLLTAEQNYQQARLSLIQAQASRLGDSVALFQALGGGWWNRGREQRAEAAPK